jgi:hypothetical protein
MDCLIEEIDCFDVEIDWVDEVGGELVRERLEGVFANS